MSALSKSIDDLRDNESQWEAFNTEGNCVVMAPPGSGKTKLLTTRMASDLGAHVRSPQGAACLTFSTAAAEELRTRLKTLGNEHRAATFVGTVHSFALQRILIPFAVAAGRPELQQLRISTTAQESKAFNEAVKDNYPQGGDTRNLSSTIQIARKHLYTESAFRRLGPGVLETAAGYRQKLRSAGLIDFDGVIEEAVDIVRSFNGIRKVIQSRYPRLYVDEYQDLAPGLDELVRLLCFDGGKPCILFAVGDPDQAVYSFNGARPELLDMLSKRSEVQTVRLDKNYRSGRDLIRSAGLFRESTHVVSGVRPGGTMSFDYCPGGLSDQIQKLTQSIIEVNKSGTPLHEVAVICATNALCMRIGEDLNNSQVPAIYRTNEYRATTATLLLEGCAAWCFLGREESGTRLSSLLASWRKLQPPGGDSYRDVVLTQVLLSVDPSAPVSAAEFVELLLDGGLADLLELPSNSEERNEVNTMLTALSDGPLRGKDAQFLAQRGMKAGRVQVMTMTSSKGLEFERVYMPALDEGSVPGYYASKDEKQMPEEKRKFYVSLTRAKEHVQFLFSGFTEDRQGYRHKNGPSRFLFDLELLER